MSAFHQARNSRIALEGKIADADMEMALRESSETAVILGVQAPWAPTQELSGILMA
jgi:hypothetical protein